MGPEIEPVGRKRSLTRSVQHRGFVAVETGGGFHGARFASTLIDRLTVEHGPSADLVDPDDVEGNATPGVAIIRALLVAGLRGWADTVARRHDNGHPTVVILPAGVSGDGLLGEPVPALVIDAASLQMHTADVVDAIAERETHQPQHESEEAILGLAEIIATLGDGWPTWVEACINAADAHSPVDRATMPTVLGAPSFRRRVVTAALLPFGDHDVMVMAQLAHFDTFSPAVATAVGGAGFAETTLSHAPGLKAEPCTR